MWVDVDAAVVAPVNILPLLDDTDFKTIESAVAYNASGMALKWNFVTTAGVQTQTAVTPTTSGVYDWTHLGGGMYSIEIPASGGGSINNDTEGFGWFSGVATGVLPWRGPMIGFRAAGLNDKIIDAAYDAFRGLGGTALPGVAAEAAGGLYTRGTGAGQLSQSANGELGVTTLTKTLTTYTGNTVQTGDGFVRLGAPAGASVSADIAAVKVDTAAIKAKTDNLPSDPADASDILSATNAIAAAISALNNISSAQVKSQVVAALSTDTYAEVTGVPAATAALVTKLGFVYAALRNKLTITATDKTFFDDSSAALWKKALTDDGTTYTEGEGTTP